MLQDYGFLCTLSNWLVYFPGIVNIDLRTVKDYVHPKPNDKYYIFYSR